jgi:hypothetical protein
MYEQEYRMEDQGNQGESKYTIFYWDKRVINQKIELKIVQTSFKTITEGNNFIYALYNEKEETINYVLFENGEAKQALDQNDPDALKIAFVFEKVLKKK